MKVRRVVTGHNQDGKARVVDDTLVEPVTLDLLPGYEFHRLWGRDERPTFPDDGSPRGGHSYFPPRDGSRFVLFTVPPGEVELSPDLDLSAALAEMERRLPGLAEHVERDNPGMHTTDTIDYDLVISGDVTLELDDGETVQLRAGDAVVQNGTRHAWRNNGSEPCVIAAILIGADRHTTD
jgi:mannose-6-phosphate isomerase-like protein (cupin superfamily)